LSSHTPHDADFASSRKRMVVRDLAARDIADRGVLEAMGKVPRHEFVWDVDRSEAYTDHPLRISEGQTISQPYMVALMTQELALTGSENVLEIGTGSGYQTAILAELSKRVHTVERIPALAAQAEKLLGRLGYDNVQFTVGDGTLGWPAAAPFDAILVTAGAPSVPASLKAQLADGGRLIIPVGGRKEQKLLVITRRGLDYQTRTSTPCIFVKLIGEEGWPEK
jgi:protein-L-isoaspartate(D-aspartate) O-methyltransferase